METKTGMVCTSVGSRIVVVNVKLDVTQRNVKLQL